ncbi:uncharacterized protein LOC124155564 [Ischnura elegans]|uniref:uncharacterized protein LOC124155564 n=1 Tax=Ischnura elegans TaxID=197161 RepID=UPI001ED88D58|nr:uncharacterized protein LOC124155564 [Ischnura elegans]XP_046385458.1 uncharacterized protein LOC124155564 [Ischnura elegans]XP_046385459.1 uncharacterized protein LOC124155564 [Ischnura elegans]XP_046385460.1 uncharacterized protein LOC124155564 [Ischnura elegans]XP_046385461.1 uncharacterized protein LOC124155564 [Ischnura elegans]
MEGSKEYFMGHPKAGYCLIFSHRSFKGERSRYHHNKEAALQIADSFHQLGFEVLIHKDYSVGQIQSIVEKVASLDHSKADCVAIVVLSARRCRGMIWAYDGEYPEELLWQPFSAERCPSMNKKPKLFFLQTFRQTRSFTQDDFTRGSPASTVVHQGPIPEDCIISWSRMEEYETCQRLGIEDVYTRYLSRELLSSTQAGFDLLTIMTRVETSVVNSMLAKEGNDRESTSEWPVFASSLNGVVVFSNKNPENIKYEDPLDEDLERYADDDADIEGCGDQHDVEWDVGAKTTGNGASLAVLEAGGLREGEVEGKVAENKVEKKGAMEEYQATCTQVLLRIVFIFLYIADEGSDIYAAIKHLLNGRMAFAHLTFLFAAVPHVQSVWIGMQKSKMANVKFDLGEALTFHIRSLWQCFIYARKSRKTYTDLSLAELRGFYAHERAWKGLEKSAASWNGDSKVIQRMYFEKMMTANLNLVPHDYLEVVNQAPFQIRSQLASLMMEKRMPEQDDLPLVISIFTSMVTLTTATHKDHYRVHFSKDWTNSLELYARVMECTAILMIRGAHAVAMSLVAATQPLWMYCICQLPHTLWGMYLFIRSMSHPRYHFKKNPVKNAVSLMGRSPTYLVFPWEYRTIENALFILDLILLVVAWKSLPEEETHPMLTWSTTVCILMVHFVAMIVSFVYRTLCHEKQCNPEVDVI